MAAKVARCGNCKTDFTSIQRAVDHSYIHKPKARRASVGKPLFMVRYDRKGSIAEVTDWPKVGVQIERGEGAKPGVGGSETGVGVSTDGHVASVWYSTPCLCSCHYGKPACDDKGCS